MKADGTGWSQLAGTLKELRLAHSSWLSPDGIVLLGGYYSGDTTELVTRTCTTGTDINCRITSLDKFPLQDDVRLL